MTDEMVRRQRELKERGWTPKSAWGQERNVEMEDEERGVWINQRFDIWGKYAVHTRMGLFGSMTTLEVNGTATLTPEQVQLLVGQTKERISNWHALNARRASV